MHGVARFSEKVVDARNRSYYICIMTHMSKHNKSTQSGCCNADGLMDPKFFKALGDPNRIAILARLAGCGRPCTVTELNACCPVDFSVVSRHLALLRDAGILHAERRGKEVHYSVRFDHVAATLRAIADAIEACCPASTSTSICCATTVHVSNSTNPSKTRRRSSARTAKADRKSRK